MSMRKFFWILLIVCIGAGFLIGEAKKYYTCPMHPQVKQENTGNCPICGMKLIQVRKDRKKSVKHIHSHSKEEPGESSDEKEELWYTCSMHPEIIQEKEGNCPICGMKLVPLKKEKELVIPQEKLSSYGIKLSKVERISGSKSINIIGNFEYNEKNICQVSAKFSGWVKKLYMNFEGAYIQKYHKLALVYSSELAKLHTEMMFYKKAPSQRENFKNILVHLEHLGLSKKEIKRLSNLNKVTYYFWLDSPCEGIITKKYIFDDSYIREGMTLFEIVDLKNMWFIGRIYESDISILNLLNKENTLYRCPMHHNIVSKTGGFCSVATCHMPLVPFNPDITITIKHPLLKNGEYTDYVELVYPAVEEETRTITFRVSVPNTTLLLRKNMYGSARIKINYKNILAVPETAVVFTGDKNIVFLYKNNKVIPRAVMLGEKYIEKEELQEDNFLIPYKTRYIQLLAGVDEGDIIISSGTFLIDAESQFRKIVIQMHNH